VEYPPSILTVFIVPDLSSRDSSGMAAGGTPLAALQPLQDCFLAKGAGIFSGNCRAGSSEAFEAVYGGVSVVRRP
jgi:hypothetical protein